MLFGSVVQNSKRSQIKLKTNGKIAFNNSSCFIKYGCEILNLANNSTVVKFNKEKNKILINYNTLIENIKVIII